MHSTPVRLQRWHGVSPGQACVPYIPSTAGGEMHNADAFEANQSVVEQALSPAGYRGWVID